MLAPNEPVSRCLKTEFTEEALGDLMEDEEQKKLDELFSKGVEVNTSFFFIFETGNLIGTEFNVFISYHTSILMG